MSTDATAWANRYQAGQQLLADIDLQVLAACLQHRLLTVEHLHQLLTPTASPRWMRAVTLRLSRAGLLDRVGMRGQARNRRWLWFPTPAGRELVEPELAQRHHVMTPQRAGNVLQRHTLLTNTVGVAFVGHARRLGHDCGPLDWDNEVAHRIGAGRGLRRLVTSDLRVRCWIHEPDADWVITRLVEIDRDRYSPLQLHEKIRAYERMRGYTPPRRDGPAPKPAWTAYYPVFPKVLVVFADRPEHVLARRAATLLDLCHGDPVLAPHLDELGVWCTTLPRLLDEGPYAPIWSTAQHDSTVDLLGRPAAAQPTTAPAPVRAARRR